MTKVTAGVVTGLVLGAAHGVLSSWGAPHALDVFYSVLGRASQGIVNGVLAAWMVPGRPPMWRAMFLSGLIGVALGGLAGIPDHNWRETVPLGAFIGVCCGAATARAR